MRWVIGDKVGQIGWILNLFSPGGPEGLKCVSDLLSKRPASGVERS